MDEMNHNVFILIKAIREVDPELAYIIDSLKDQRVGDDRVRTFEDCARVEQDIISKLNSTNPFQ